MKKALLPLVALALTACSSNEQPASFAVVPLPREVCVNPQEKPFRLDESISIAYPADHELLERNAAFLAEYVQQSTGKALPLKPLAEGENCAKTITLRLDPSVAKPEGYRLTCNAEGIQISGLTEMGIFYGIQTLRKAIPATAQGATILIPAGEVNDAPRFGYRGMHLDVCRHFFPLEFVKKYIDLLALHNMNFLHWHLTDDQGWRIEIKKYPRLTEVGAWRDRTVVGRWDSGEYDSVHYGGFYTQEQLKEIVQYAAERYVSIIPEVDLPGHMLAALAAYPELGCTGGPYEVCPDWGVFEDVLCLGNDKTYEFLEDVLTEVMEIFPSPYIHIGGDEAPRTRWAKCPKCQARIKAEGLKADKEHTAEDRLQTYCMARMERFLNEHGRKIIGWDEILEGDVAPNATIMSWRGSEGGIKAAQMGHNVIMTPNNFCYFDYYQTDKTDGEPLGIGGFVPIEKVYSLEPTDRLTPEQARHILGAQANLWTEYIATTEHVEYMVLPRMAALAEVQWTLPEKKDYKDFTTRLMRLIPFYQRDGLNYAKHIFDITTEFTATEPEGSHRKAVLARLSTVDNAPIRYTLDGTEPTADSPLYDGEGIVIDRSADLRAIAFRPEGKSRMVEQKISFNKATLCPIQLTGTQPHARYAFKGASTLVDGLNGNETYKTGAWLGFNAGDVTAVIDLGAGAADAEGKPGTTEIHRVGTQAFVNIGDWIMGAAGMEVYVSDDNRTFRPVGAKGFPVETALAKQVIEHYEIDFEPVQARYVKIVVKQSTLPKGHPNEGHKAFLFIDEIEVE